MSISIKQYYGGNKMGENIAKFQIKFGDFEVSYEGDKSFMKDDILHLIEKSVGLYAEHGKRLPVEPVASKMNGASANMPDKLDLSANTIATILEVKSGPDLVIAASAKLTLADGKDRIDRKEILSTMKTATPFYKKTYNNNFSRYLDRLVKADRLRLVAANVYTISPQERKSLSGKLAQQG